MNEEVKIESGPAHAELIEALKEDGAARAARLERLEAEERELWTELRAREEDASEVRSRWCRAHDLVNGEKKSLELQRLTVERLEGLGDIERGVQNILADLTTEQAAAE